MYELTYRNLFRNDAILFHFLVQSVGYLIDLSQTEIFSRQLGYREEV